MATNRPKHRLHPAEIIHGLMRRNPDELGFVPSTTIADRWVQQDLYILQRNRWHKPIGYLLHGHVNDDRTLYIHHASLDLTRRNRATAKSTVAQLIKRALHAAAKTIFLRTLSDLDGVAFWQSCSFVPVAVSPDAPSSQKSLIQYEMTLPEAPRQLTAGHLRDRRRSNA